MVSAAIRDKLLDPPKFTHIKEKGKGKEKKADGPGSAANAGLETAAEKARVYTRERETGPLESRLIFVILFLRVS